MVRKKHNQVLFSKQILMFDWIRILREEGKKSRMLPSFLAWVPGWKEKRSLEWKADLVERFYFWFSKLFYIRITWDALKSIFFKKKISFNRLIFTLNVNIMRAQTYWSECTMTSNSIFHCLLYSSWGSHDRDTGVLCHSLLQWIMFCQNSLLWTVLLGWPCMAAHSFTELHKPLCHNKTVIPEGGWQIKTVCWKTETFLCQQKPVWSRLWSSQWSCMVVRTGL